MPRKLITCLETAHLEDIEYEDTPCGMVILSCSRFAPNCERVDCPRTCAARLDQRDRARSIMADPLGWLVAHRYATDLDTE